MESNEMNEVYQRVADTFSARIHEVFLSEDSMRAEFSKIFTHLEFDRTNHGSTLLHKLFRDCWYAVGPEIKAEPTNYDRISVCHKLYPLLDYNLFTQVLLNLQSYTGMVYMAGDAEKEIERMKDEWPKEAKLSPFEPKARMVKKASTDEEKKHNNVLSALKSLKVISQFTPQVSFRLTPIGSTPAFADSRNISMIGIGGDKYLHTAQGLSAYYIHWAPGSSPIMAEQQSDGGLKAEGIPYSFYSKSGGEILQEVLFARKIMAEVFASHDTTVETCIMVPRMSSVLVVTGQQGTHLKRAFEALKQQYPILELSEGGRG
jgi:hypothetical protein